MATQLPLWIRLASMQLAPARWTDTFLEQWCGYGGCEAPTTPVPQKAPDWVPRSVPKGNWASVHAEILERRAELTPPERDKEVDSEKPSVHLAALSRIEGMTSPEIASIMRDVLTDVLTVYGYESIWSNPRTHEWPRELVETVHLGSGRCAILVALGGEVFLPPSVATFFETLCKRLST